MKALLFALLLSLFTICTSFFQSHIVQLIHWIQNLGPTAPVVFIGIYCSATLLFLPTLILSFAGGALFGPVVGLFLNISSATLGATCAFLISRYYFFDWFSRQKSKKFDQVISGVEQRGWQFIALLRLFPIIPFNIINYSLGLTRIPLKHYLIATFVFMIPLEIMSTYGGYAGMDYFLHSGQLYKRISLFSFVILSVVFIVLKYFKSRVRIHEGPE